MSRRVTNRYEIYAILKPILKHNTPKPSTIYAITRRHGFNRLSRCSSPLMTRAGAGPPGPLPSRDTIVGTKHRYYLVGLIDAYTRLAWAEVVHQDY